MDLNELGESLIQGEVDKVAELTKAALDKGVEVQRILNEGLLAGMDVVGQRFKADELFIPEVLLSAQAMAAGMDVLEPALVGAGLKLVGKIALGTVKGDIHDLGKNMVAMMLKGAGFKVIDLGVDIPPEKFVEVVEKEEVQLVGMSALLTTTAPAMKTTIQALEEAGLRARVKVIVGGAIVTQAFADKIGADAYGEDAIAAVDKARTLLSTV